MKSTHYTSSGSGILLQKRANYLQTDFRGSPRIRQDILIGGKQLGTELPVVMMLVLIVCTLVNMISHHCFHAFILYFCSQDFSIAFVTNQDVTFALWDLSLIFVNV